jgi:carbon monoxide dehydrogenase subunit G
MAMPKVEGSERLALAQDQVWRLLNDPDTLGASIPGCRGFERDGDAEHRYRTAIKVALGAVTGVYEGVVEYTDVEEPSRCTIKINGKGDKGTIEGQGAITLAAAGDATEVGYRGEFKITGPVAGVGQRMAPGVSRKMIVETLRNLERHGTVASQSPADAGAEATGSVEGGGDAAPATGRSPEAPVATAGDGDAFRPLAVSPGVAFAAGCALGALIGALAARR